MRPSRLSIGHIATPHIFWTGSAFQFLHFPCHVVGQSCGTHATSSTPPSVNGPSFSNLVARIGTGAFAICNFSRAKFPSTEIDVQVHANGGLWACVNQIVKSHCYFGSTNADNRISDVWRLQKQINSKLYSAIREALFGHRANIDRKPSMQCSAHAHRVFAFRCRWLWMILLYAERLIIVLLFFVRPHEHKRAPAIAHFVYGFTTIVICW